MITKFDNYIMESKEFEKSIDYLETLNPDQLGMRLLIEVNKILPDSPDVQYIQNILTVGCPIDYRDWHGLTFLHYAARGGHLEVIKFLISKGADVNAKDEYDRTAWTMAYSNVRKAVPQLKPNI